MINSAELVAKHCDSGFFVKDASDKYLAKTKYLRRQHPYDALKCSLGAQEQSLGFKVRLMHVTKTFSFDISKYCFVMQYSLL